MSKATDMVPVLDIDGGVRFLEPKEMVAAWRKAVGHIAERDLPQDLHPTSMRGRRYEMFRPRKDVPLSAMLEDENDRTGCGHMVILPGYGKEKYPFLSIDHLVAASIDYLNEVISAYRNQGRTLFGAELEAAGGDGASLDESGLFAYIRRHGLPMSTLSPRVLAQRVARQRARAAEKARERAKDDINVSQVVKSGPGDASKISVVSALGSDGASAVGGALIVRSVAGTLAEIMHRGRFKAVIARQFDPLKGAVNWARDHLLKDEPKFLDVVNSLWEHLIKLEEIYGGALPRVIEFLHSQYPNVSEEERLSAAVAVLNEQMAEILYILSIWIDSFAQQRDGMYKQLLYLVFTVEEAYYLNRTGDVTGEGDPKIKDAIKNTALNIGDVFMARFSDQGPATIPGGRGPVGAHALEVPHDESDVLVLYLPLYMHEFRHDFFNDVEGLADESTAVVVEAIQKAHKAGKFKFKNKHIVIGADDTKGKKGQAVETIMLCTQVFGQTHSETDADQAGGVLLTGPAYLYSMLATFSAFQMRGQNPMSVNRMLRHRSYFAIGEKNALVFEPHMPDYIRAHMVADGLESIDCKLQADACRKPIDQAAGLPLPEFIIWRNVDPKSPFQFEIRIPVSDLRQVSPVVVDAIMNTPLQSLGGVSMRQLFNWTKKRQEKVEALVASLMAGKSTIPWDMGDFYAIYVAAAAITAVWRLTEQGHQPMIAAGMVEHYAREMMDQIMAKHPHHTRTQAPALATTDDAVAPGVGSGGSGDKAAPTVVPPASDTAPVKDGGAGK